MAKSPSQQTSGAVSPQAHDKRRQKPRVQVVKEEYPDRTVIIQTEEEDEYVILELPRALEDYKTVTRPGEDPQIAVKVRISLPSRQDFPDLLLATSHP